ncbi:MAG: hypothetical protein ACLFOY_06415 [Desulfatibacillaceae bacterium]
MDDRVRDLEKRLAHLEQEVAELKRHVGLPEKQQAAPSSGDGRAIVSECENRGGRASISVLRDALDWDDQRFDEALTRLHGQGVVELHAEEAGMMSLSRMGASYMGDDGNVYTEVSLV